MFISRLPNRPKVLSSRITGEVVLAGIPLVRFARLTRSYRRFDTIAIMNTKQLLFAFAFALLVVFTGSPVSVHTQHMSEKDSSAKAGKIWRRFN